MLRQHYEVFPLYRRMNIPFACIDPRRETKQQVRILENQLGRHRFYGLKVHPRATQTGFATLGREGRPLLFAKAWDLPILLHTAYPGSPNRYPRMSDLLAIARAHSGLRFSATHFCGFHQATFDKVAQYDNVWVDSAASRSGAISSARCPESASPDLIASAPTTGIRQRSSPPCRRSPEKFMWSTDNPAHSL